VLSYTRDEAELDKRITALAMAGERMILLDNLTGSFGNGTLDRALTTTRWRGRVLGYSRMFTGPLLACWHGTGDNVQVAGDTARRVCHVRLETPLEAPDKRNDFRHPRLLEWVRDNRPRLLAGALTSLRGYCAAGRPDMGLPAWGSFEGWSALPRSAVVWCGLP